MAKAAKQPAIIESESLSAEETKQMDEMRATDRIAPAVSESEPEAVESKIAPEEAGEVTLEKTEKQETKQKTVPHEALESERQKRKAAEKELQEARLNEARFDERMKMINEALAKPEQKPQKMEVPDPEKDALGALKAMTHNYTLTEQENRILKQSVEQQQQVSVVQSQINDVIAKGTQAAVEYKKTAPDYDDAFNALSASRLQELKHMGLNEQQAQQKLYEDKLIITAQALTSGQNPAEVFYSIAKSRGYQTKASVTNASAQHPDAATQISILTEGQKVNQSLSNIQGGAPNAGNFINGKDLATMSDAQFAKVMKTIGGDSEAMKKVFGG